MAFLYQLWAFLRRDYLLASSSRLAFAWQAVSVVFAAPILYYLGRLVQPAASHHLVPFGDDYFAFVIVGVALFGLLSTSMGALAAAVRHEQMIGTFEALLATPASLLTLSAGASLWSVLMAAGQALLYFLMGALVFGLDFGRANLVSAALILALTLSLFAALGLASAAFVIVFKHSDPMTSLFAAVSALLAGVFYPTTVLPPLLRDLAQVIPLTHALRALRLALLQGAGIAAVQREVLILILFLVCLVPLAVWAFWWAVRQAKSSGTLSAY